MEKISKKFMNGKHQKESSQLPIQTILFGREVASSLLPGSALDSNPEIFLMRSLQY
jgi:hypothetical protein